MFLMYLSATPVVVQVERRKRVVDKYYMLLDIANVLIA